MIWITVSVVAVFINDITGFMPSPGLRVLISLTGMWLAWEYVNNLVYKPKKEINMEEK